MIVANHNPANLPLEIVEILVPHGNYRVQKLEGQNWVDVEASVICNEQA